MKRATTFVSFIVLFLGVCASGGTYHVSTGGNNANPGTEALPWGTVHYGVNHVGPGDTVLIRGGTYHEHVVMQHSGAPGSPITVANYPGEQPVIDCNGLGSFGGVFEVYYTDHVRASGLRVMNCNGSGIWTKYANDVWIENCSTYNTTSSGVKIKYSNDIVVRGNDIEQACLGGAEECITVKQFSDGVLVEGNHIHNCMKEGIDIKEGARNAQVVGNHIHNVERQGLYADAWNVPTFNIVYRDNVIHDCGFGLGACAETSGQLSDVWFVNNLVYNCDGPGMFCKDWGGDANDTHPILNVYYINNTVYNCSWGWGAGMDIGNNDAENVEVRNHIISQCRVSINVNREPISKTIEYNLCESIAGLPAGWAVAGSPGFVNSAGGDFHLLGGSDAIDAGSAVEAPGVDHDGNLRPRGGLFDIGAYEYLGACANFAGDIDGDGHVTLRDFAVVGQQWRRTGAGLSADIAHDEIVDEYDAEALFQCWPM
jgi:hypothetical protein